MFFHKVSSGTIHIFCHRIVTKSEIKMMWCNKIYDKMLGPVPRPPKGMVPPKWVGSSKVL